MKKWLESNKKHAYFLVFIFVVLFLAGSLYDFSMILLKNETRKGYENIEYSVKQHVLIVQNQLNQYFVAMKKDALMFADISLKDQEGCLEIFGKMKELPEMDYIVMGIADTDGDALLSTGESIQIKDMRFFREAVSGNQFIEDTAEEDSTAVIAVPVWNEKESIKGVMFGVIPLDELKMFEQILGNKISKYLFLLDGEGNYIDVYGMTITESNLKNTLDKVKFDKENTQVTSSTQVMEAIEERKTVTFAVSYSQKQEIGVLMPIPDSSWYVCEVVDREIITQDVKYYQNDVMLLTVKVLTMAVLLIGIYIYYSVRERKKIQNLNTQLSLNEELYRVIAEHSDQCFFTYNGLTRQIQFMNEKYREFGIPKQNIELHCLLKILEKNNLTAYHRVEKLAAAVYDYVPETEQEVPVTIDGQKRFLKICLINLFDEYKMISRSIGIVEDITEQKENEIQMRREQEFRKSLLADCLGYLEVDVDEDMVIENSFASGMMENMKGSFSQMIRFYVDKKVVTEYREKVLSHLSKQSIEEQYRRGIMDTILEYKTLESDGECYWTECEIITKKVDNKKQLTAYLVFRNIDQRKKEQIRLEKEATIDPLTGALKRNAAVDKMEVLQKKEIPEERCSVFMILDLDNFKQLNDTLGHMCGDQALKDFVEKAKQNCRHDDIICRLGGDEFVIIMNVVARKAVEKKVAELQKVFEAVYEKDGHAVTVTASAGVALMPDHGNSFDELYAVADKALYKVKTSTKNSYSIAE